MVRSLDRISTRAQTRQSIRSSTTRLSREYNSSSIRTATTTAAPSGLENENNAFELAFAPPKDETAEQREFRIRSEADAKRMSDEIDEMLKAEKATRAKNAKRVVKVLLLGQSESGKSTTVKNFQLRYTPKAWHTHEEQSFWRAVIQLNLIRSILTIVDILNKEILRQRQQTQNTEANLSPSPNPNPDSNEDEKDKNHVIKNKDVRIRNEDIVFTLSHRALIQRLSLLRGVQRDLEKRLGNGSLDPLPAPDGVEVDVDGVPFTGGSARADVNRQSVFIGSDTEGDENENENENTGDDDGDGDNDYPVINPGPVKRAQVEFSVHSATGWKGVLDKWRQPRPSSPSPSPSPSFPSSSSPSSSSNLSTNDAQLDNEIEREAERITKTIIKFREDMMRLWNDEFVKMLLDRLDVGLDVSGGFFLNDIARITQRQYMPSDDDIIRARLRTVGVQEYHFTIDSSSGDRDEISNGNGNNNITPQARHEWILYDVGGTRTLRLAWPPFFTSIHAILFLAPISTLNEVLHENPRINRLEDTLHLWRSICSNKLLLRVQFVLFLNKCDLLRRKMERGLRVREFITSFRERENEFGVVVRYFKLKFREMLKQYSPEPRPFYCYLTSVIDTKATNFTLQAVQEGILREHLRSNIV